MLRLEAPSATPSRLRAAAREAGIRRLTASEARVAGSSPPSCWLTTGTGRSPVWRLPGLKKSAQSAHHNPLDFVGARRKRAGPRKVWRWRSRSSRTAHMRRVLCGPHGLPHTKQGNNAVGGARRIGGAGRTSYRAGAPPRTGRRRVPRLRRRGTFHAHGGRGGRGAFRVGCVRWRRWRRLKPAYSPHRRRR